jgi:hypothetical protein
MSRWIYEPTISNEADAAAVGWLRQSAYLATPEANRRYSEGDIWEIWQHSIAALSEIAFAAMMGTPNFIPSYNTHKGEPDFQQWEVRYGFSQDNGLPPTHMRLSGSVDKLTAPYVLLTGGAEKKFKRSAMNDYKSLPLKAEGWIWGHEGATPENFVGENDKGEPMYRVPITSLRSMTELE